MSSRIKVGIAGFGLSGKVFHFPLLNESDDFEVVAVQSSRSIVIHEEFPALRVVHTMDELCSLPLDLVVVCVPNFLHFEYVSKALAANMHVVVEKPFAVNSSDAARMVELSKLHKKILTVFHNRRWDADFQTIRSILESEQLGEVVYYEAHFDRFKPQVDDRWKEQTYPGGGVLFDLGSHLIDQALTLFGQPRRVFADITSQRKGAVQDDYFHLILDFGRTRAVLHASALVPHVGPRFVVHGTRGSFVKHGMDPQEDQLKRKASILSDEYGKEMMESFGQLVLAKGDGLMNQRVPSKTGSYPRFYQELAQAIHGQSPPPIDPKDAIQVIKTIELAKASARQGSWVDWPQG